MGWDASIVVGAAPPCDDGAVSQVWVSIVPTVDVAGGRVVLDPPDGLLDPQD